MKSGWEDLEKVSIRHLPKKLDIFEAKQKYVWISQTDFFLAEKIHFKKNCYSDRMILKDKRENLREREKKTLIYFTNY